MGPPSEDGGNRVCPCSVMKAQTLQWGRRPRTAEIRYANLNTTGSAELQWGRRPRTAEIILA